MKHLQNSELLLKYIKKYQLQRYFSEELTSMSDLLFFDSREFLIRQGECSDYLFFLLSGQVKIYPELFTVIP